MASGLLSIALMSSVFATSSAASLAWRARRRSTAEGEPVGDTSVVNTVRILSARKLGWLLVALGCVAAVAGMFADGVPERHYQHLEEVGVRAPGNVTRIGAGALEVDYTFEAINHHLKLTEFDHRDFSVGKSVTVFVNPSDPADATVEGVQPASSLATTIETVSLFAFLFLVGFGALACHRASLAGDAVLMTGWRPALVEGRSTSWSSLVRDGDGPWFTFVRFPFGIRKHRPEPPLFAAGRVDGPIVLADQSGVIGVGRRRVRDGEPGGSGFDQFDRPGAT
jgi:hypothetical protein